MTAAGVYLRCPIAMKEVTDKRRQAENAYLRAAFAARKCRDAATRWKHGIKEYLTNGGRIEVARGMAGPSIAKPYLTHQFRQPAMRFAPILKAVCEQPARYMGPI